MPKRISQPNQIDQKYLNSIFEYKDGMLFWKVQLSNIVKVGQRAGSQNNSGYRIINLCKKHFVEQHIVWIMHHGDIPEGYEIDHRNRIRNDNKIGNLRLATREENRMNTIYLKNNIEESKGVTFDKKYKKFKARIMIKGWSKNLGFFDTKEEAQEAYKLSSLEFQKEFSIYFKNQTD